LHQAVLQLQNFRIFLTLYRKFFNITEFDVIFFDFIWIWNDSRQELEEHSILKLIIANLRNNGVPEESRRKLSQYRANGYDHIGYWAVEKKGKIFLAPHPSKFGLNVFYLTYAFISSNKTITVEVFRMRKIKGHNFYTFEPNFP